MILQIAETRDPGAERVDRTLQPNIRVEPLGLLTTG